MELALLRVIAVDVPLMMIFRRAHDVSGSVQCLLPVQMLP